MPPRLNYMKIQSDVFICSHQERKGTAKLDFLRKIETEMQKKWEQEKAFESDAPKVEAET